MVLVLGCDIDWRSRSFVGVGDSDRPREISYTQQRVAKSFQQRVSGASLLVGHACYLQGVASPVWIAHQIVEPLPVVQHCRGEQVARWLPREAHDLRHGRSASPERPGLRAARTSSTSPPGPGSTEAPGDCLTDAGPSRSTTRTPPLRLGRPTHLGQPDECNSFGQICNKQNQLSS
jgi:hypothetical protein